MPAERENDTPAALASAALSFRRGRAVLSTTAMVSSIAHALIFDRSYEVEQGRVDLELTQNALPPLMHSERLSRVFLHHSEGHQVARTDGTFDPRVHRSAWLVRAGTIFT